MYSVLLAGLFGAAAATPVAKRAVSDTDILNYALTLEHLENAFYGGAVQKFDNKTFASVGADYGRFKQIAQHEQSHVDYLSSALGNAATKPCNYSFPYTDVTSFVALASVLESVGVSAYLGAAGLIQNPAYLTVAGSILTTESRHQAYVAYVLGNAPWSGPYDTPQQLSQIYSLAAPFITSCPSSNPKLPVQAFPAVNVTGDPSSGSATFGFSNSLANGTSNLYVVYYSGLSTEVRALQSGNKVEVPNTLNGTVFAVVSKVNSTNITDADTVAGPAILQLYSRLAVSGGSGGQGSGELNTTAPNTSGQKGNGNDTQSGNGGNGGHNGAGAVGVKGMTVAAGLFVAGVAALAL